MIRDEAPTIRNQSEIEGAIRETAPEASTQYAEKFIEDIYNEISALPDDYQDTEYIETQLKNADLAERIKYNTLTDEDYAAANEFINELEAADYIDLANELRAASGYEFEDNNQYIGYVAIRLSKDKKDIINFSRALMLQVLKEGKLLMLQKSGRKKELTASILRSGLGIVKLLMKTVSRLWFIMEQKIILRYSKI